MTVLQIRALPKIPRTPPAHAEVSARVPLLVLPVAHEIRTYLFFAAGVVRRAAAHQ